MSFLRPHLKERDSISYVDSVTSDDDGNSDDNEDLCGELENINGLSEDTYEAQFTQNKNSSTITSQLVCKPIPKNSSLTKKIKLSEDYPESASKTLMQYILQQKGNETKSKEDDINLDMNDTFFSSMSLMVKQFSPYHQHVARSKIFSIVSEIELQHITRACSQEFPMTAGVL